MAKYRIYLRDDEQIVSHANAECASDREACMVAEYLIVAGMQAEVWNGLRRVWLIDHSMAAGRYRFID